MAMSAEHINTFLLAATKILKDMCQMETVVQKPCMRDSALTDDSVVIKIGLTGQLQGNVMVDMPRMLACEIASKMCMMPITELNEISKSALSELGNMIFGNAATLFSTKGIAMDITPPSLLEGSEAFAGGNKNLCVPVTYDNHTMGFNFAVME